MPRMQSGNVLAAGDFARALLWAGGASSDQRSLMEPFTQRCFRFESDEMVVTRAMQARQQRWVAAHHQGPAVAGSVFGARTVGEIFVVRKIHGLDAEEDGEGWTGVEGLLIPCLEAGWRGVVACGDVDGAVGPYGCCTVGFLSWHPVSPHAPKPNSRRHPSRGKEHERAYASRSIRCISFGLTTVTIHTLPRMT